MKIYLDGVNDSPSLKAANVGVAMGITGTDVAKGAADIILQDDKFTTIEKAIKEGRNIYENIKKSIIFAISTNISEIIAIFTTILIGLPSPLKAMHILWINLLTDSLPCFALGVDPNSSSNVMKKKPRKENEGIFANGGLSMVIAYGLLIAFVILCAFLFQPIKYLIDSGSAFTWSNIINAYSVDGILMKSQTYAFCAFALTELFQAVGMRDLDRSILKFNMFDNKMMLVALAVGLGAQILVTEIPFLAGLFGVATLSIIEWLCLAALSASTIVMHEIFVVVRRNSKKS